MADDDQSRLPPPAPAPAVPGVAATEPAPTAAVAATEPAPTAAVTAAPEAASTAAAGSATAAHADEAALRLAREQEMLERQRAMEQRLAAMEQELREKEERLKAAEAARLAALAAAPTEPVQPAAPTAPAPAPTAPAPAPTPTAAPAFGGIVKTDSSYTAAPSLSMDDAPTLPVSIEQHKLCKGIVKALLENKASLWFKEPVDPVALGLPDYFTVVKSPMDLGTINRKLDSSAYPSAKQFVADVRLVFSNARLYNPANADVVAKGADPLERIFDRRLPKLVEQIRREAQPPVPAPAAPTAANLNGRTASDADYKRRYSDASADDMRPKRAKHEPPPKDLLPLERTASSGSLKKVKLSPALKFCQQVLREVSGKKYWDSVWPFLEPVDIVKLNIPDYYTIIKNPMDLGTVKSKLEAGKYRTAQEFASDVRLVFSNCFRYNGEHSDVSQMCARVQKVFESKFAQMPEFPATAAASESEADEGDKSDMETDSSEAEPTPAPKKIKKDKKHKKHKGDRKEHRDKSKPKPKKERTASSGSAAVSPSAAGASSAANASNKESSRMLQTIQQQMQILQSQLLSMTQVAAAAAAAPIAAVSPEPKAKPAKPSSHSKPSSTGGSSSSSAAKKKKKKRSSSPSSSSASKHKADSDKKKKKKKSSGGSSNKDGAPARTKAEAVAKKTGSGKDAIAEFLAKDMTFDEKKELSLDINKLPGEKLGQIVEIIHRRNPTLPTASGEIEIDIDSLDTRTLRDMERYVREQLRKPWGPPVPQPPPKEKPKADNGGRATKHATSSDSDSDSSDDDSGSDSDSA